MTIKYINYDTIKQNKDHQIYIYGAGSYAFDIKKALSKIDCMITAFIVDDEYIKNTRSYFEITRVISYSEYEQQQQKDDIVINGIANVSRFRQHISTATIPEICVFFKLDLLWTYDDSYFINNQNDIGQIEGLFDDDLSVNVFRSFLEAKRTGVADGVIKYAIDEPTYFNTVTKDKYSGAYVDCGAYDGDSVEAYISFVKDKESNDTIFAFEPDIENFNKLSRRFNPNTIKENDGNKSCNVICINKGTWIKETRLLFSPNNEQASGIIEIADDTGDSNDTGGLERIDVIDIDSVVGDTKVGFIKMDVEGSELESLKGAEKIIRRDHPILAISAYHKKEDLIEIPRYIKRFDNDEWKYHLFLRHHGICEFELVLYAIAERGSLTAQT